jgi:hypothetical protein
MATTIKPRGTDLSDRLPEVKPHPQRLTQEFVSSEFKRRGWTLHSVYRNWETPLEFTCDRGHDHSTTWNTIKQGSGCAYCQSRVVHHSDVEAAFKAAGYTLIGQYEAAAKKMAFICDRGHSHSISWHEFNKGTRCGQCKVTGYKPGIPGRLYYVRFDFPEFSLWKIGISNRSIGMRFRGERVKPIILMDSWYADGSVPPKMEAEAKRKYRKHQYKGSALRNGNSDCFTIDVLGFDDSQ